MAESNNAAAPALHTNIESGNFDEKAAHRIEDPAPAKTTKGEEEEDEDIDALIEDLESQDGNAFDDEEEGDGQPGGTGRVVPEEMLQTDTRVGLTEGKLQSPYSPWPRRAGLEWRKLIILQLRLPTVAASMVSTR